MWKRSALTQFCVDYVVRWESKNGETCVQKEKDGDERVATNGGVALLIGCLPVARSRHGAIWQSREGSLESFPRGYIQAHVPDHHRAETELKVLCIYFSLCLLPLL